MIKTKKFLEDDTKKLHNTCTMYYVLFSRKEYVSQF